MTKTTDWDCDDCRECYHRGVFEQGVPWCKLYSMYCPRDGCEMGVNKKVLGVE